MHLSIVLSSFVVGAALAFGQAPALGRAVRVESASSAAPSSGATPGVRVTVHGSGFVAHATVRVRAAGRRGSGESADAEVADSETLTFALPPSLAAGASALEVRVKNPDGSASDWSPILAPGATAGAPAAHAPAVAYLTPWQIPALAKRVRVTLHGERFVDGATVLLAAGEVRAEAKGYLRESTLVFTVPDALLATPGTVHARVRGTDGALSPEVTFEVLPAPKPGERPPARVTPFLARVEPSKLEAGEREITLAVRDAAAGAVVLFRREGERSDGERLAARAATSRDGKPALAVVLPPEAAPEAGFYELRVLNPDGLASNWVRVEVVR